jgi:lactate dehydrogenase-like 2-hydroxyacid dehydrogenase
VVSQIAVGVDNIDRAAANRHKIPFTHTPDVLTDATAEYAFFMIGACARRLYPAEAPGARAAVDDLASVPAVARRRGHRSHARVIGTGRIGKSVVAKAMGFDMDVLCHSSRGPAALADYVAAVQRVMDLRHDEGVTTRRQKVEAVSLEDALRRADFVSLHVPLTLPGAAKEPTFHLIDESGCG